MIVGVVQYEISWENPEANFRKIGKLLKRYPPPKGSLLLLPEMFATGFSMNPGVPDYHSQCAKFLKHTAKSKGIYLGGGVAHSLDETLRNSYLVFSPEGELLAEYHKVHPFSIGEEGRLYTGGEGAMVVNVAEVPVGLTICYDLRFPELYRRLMGIGAMVMVVAANWPAKRDLHWRTLLRARAIENQAYVVGVNRTGSDPNFEYRGSSAVISPTGEIILSVTETEGIFYSHLDMKGLRTYRKKFPVLRDIKDWLFGKGLQS